MEERKLELCNEELQDIVGKMPTKIEKYGLYIMFVIISILIIGSFFFKYPDTLDASIIITNSTPPISVVAHSSGNMELINPQNNRIVKEGEVIGVIENTANYKDVLKLENEISKLKNNEISIQEMVKWMNEQNLCLGTILNNYIAFRNSALNYCMYSEQQYYFKKIKYSEERLKLRLAMEKKSLNDIKERVLIYKRMFERDSILHSQNMITEEDYQHAILTYKQRLLEENNIDRDKIQRDIQEITEKENIVDMYEQNIQNKKEYEQTLRNSTSQLIECIKEWENSFLLRSPTEGSLNMVGVWGENQFVSNGETVFVIIPKRLKKPVGRALLSAIGAGKATIGQKVIVSIKNYPDEDYGHLEGVVSSVSNVPTSEGYYIVDISFPKGLKTIYHKDLPWSQQMQGSARIVTQDRRLSDIFIKPMIKLFKTQESLGDE